MSQIVKISESSHMKLEISAFISAKVRPKLRRLYLEIDTIKQSKYEGEIKRVGATGVQVSPLTPKV